jgi:hypothetical protein
MAHREATTAVSAIVWCECPVCGHGWPFPYASAPSAMRDWRCHACIEAKVASAVRALREIPRYGFVDAHSTLDAPPANEWVKWSDLDLALESL